MDLVWWNADENDKENFTEFILHVERESWFKKDIDTIDKLFSDTHKEFVPKCVIGIQNIESQERIHHLNELIIKRNKKQKSVVLMIYRFYDKEKDIDKIWAYQIDENGLTNQEPSKAFCFIDQTGYWTMCFEWEYDK